MSVHRLLTDHRAKEKLKTALIAAGCAALLIILVLTRLSAVQDAPLQFKTWAAANWAKSSARFIIIAAPWLCIIPVNIGIKIILRKRRALYKLRVYETGLGFLYANSEGESYADFSKIKLRYGKMRESFYIEAPDISIKPSEYSWGEFTQPDVLQNNLERYGKWN
jgi:hypothetical protein